MRLVGFLAAASLIGCASYPVRTEVSTALVTRADEVQDAQSSARRRAERRRRRGQRVATASAALELLSTSLSAAVAIKEGKTFPRSSDLGETTLLLVGDDYGETFLGCLSCDPYDITSIFNAEGDHGSRHSPVSIRNRFSRFGSSFSNFSACNRRASRPPRIVDPDGNIHGRFTLNTSDPEASVDGTTLRLAHMLCGRPPR